VNELQQLDYDAEQKAYQKLLNYGVKVLTNIELVTAYSYLARCQVINQKQSEFNTVENELLKRLFMTYD
jgi:hypothetical protein